VIFAALASTVAVQGIGIVLVYAKFVGGFYLALLILWSLPAGRFDHRRGQAPCPELIQRMREAGAAGLLHRHLGGRPIPARWRACRRSARPRKIVSFVLPLGYSFNLDGSTMYTTFAALFIAQAYGIHLTAGPAGDDDGDPDGHLQGYRRGCRRASLVVIMAVLAPTSTSRWRASRWCSASTTCSTWAAAAPNVVGKLGGPRWWCRSGRDSWGGPLTTEEKVAA